MRLTRGLLCVISLFVGASAAAAQTPVPLTVFDREATGSFALPGGFGGDLTISFEEVLGLHATALEASVQVVDPNDPALLARLPSDVSVRDSFPVLLKIEPAASSALSFSGVVAISLHTHNLTLTRNSTLALYSASGGGAFRDITRFVGVGSYRAGGDGGGFSEFLIVKDARLIDTIIASKFNLLQASLNDLAGSIPAPVLSVLQGLLSQAQLQWELGLTLAAIGEVTAFSDTVKAQSGAVIPDIWRAHDNRINIAGVLRSQAETLKFSLTIKADRSP